MKKGLMLFALISGLALLAAPVQARPLPPAQLALIHHWIGESAEPTPPAIVVHHGACPGGVGVVACANVDYDPAAPAGQRWFVSTGSIWVGTLSARSKTDRFDFMHELGHIEDAEVYTPAIRQRLERLLGMVGDWYPDARFDPGTTPPFERAADAYAMCSIHRSWPGTWWHFVVGHRNDMTIAGGNPTPYDFRAGRTRYNEICSLIRSVR